MPTAPLLSARVGSRLQPQARHTRPGRGQGLAAGASTSADPTGPISRFLLISQGYSTSRCRAGKGTRLVDPLCRYETVAAGVVLGHRVGGCLRADRARDRDHGRHRLELRAATRGSTHLRHDVAPPPVGSLDDKDVTGLVLPRRARGHVCPHVRGRGPSLGRPQGRFDLRRRKAGFCCADPWVVRRCSRTGSTAGNREFDGGRSGALPFRRSDERAEQRRVEGGTRAALGPFHSSGAAPS